jgi:hypothetical protein
MKYLVFLFLLTGCFSSEQTILEISPKQIYYARTISDLTCPSVKETLFRTIHLAKEPFSLLCQKGYLGGFWFKRDYSLKIAMAAGDAGDYWSYSSLIFKDDELGLILWRIKYFIKDRAFSCETGIGSEDCSKIIPKYECSIDDEFYNLKNNDFEKIDFKGNKPDRKLKKDKFFLDNCKSI